MTRKVTGDCRLLNEIFNCDGPDWIDIEEDKTLYDGCYIGGFSGRKHTEEAKRRIQAASAGKNNPRYGVKIPLEERHKYGPKHGGKGAFNSRAKTYILTSPQGVKHSVKGGLRVFCLENSISYSTMRAAIDNNRTGPRSSGWEIYEKQDVKKDTFSGFKL